MSKKPSNVGAKAQVADAESKTLTRKVTRAETLVSLMRTEAGATAPELAAAVGWQIHSVRGFIAGTLKKRTDLGVTTTREGGATRYRVVAS